MKIILASKSPRRKELLKYITTDFITVVSNIDEKYDTNLSPQDIVLFLSQSKAKVISKDYPNDIVIGCDTIVSLDNLILEKPVDKEDAFKMLKTLSNKTHQVYTGVTIIYNNIIDSFYQKTEVTFYPLSDEEITKYINTKEPFDKAGAYGIQGFGSKFIKEIHGDYFTVVGLPIGELYQRLKKITGW
ncbi:MAG TPA: Maf family protein [Haloplasmataceae bacterium]